MHQANAAVLKRPHIPCHQETSPRILDMYLGSHVQIPMLAPRSLHKPRNVFSHYSRGGANRLTPPIMNLNQKNNTVFLTGNQAERVMQSLTMPTWTQMYGLQ